MCVCVRACAYLYECVREREYIGKRYLKLVFLLLFLVCSCFDLVFYHQVFSFQ